MQKILSQFLGPKILYPSDLYFKIISKMSLLIIESTSIR